MRLVRLVDVVEGVHKMLRELRMRDAIHMADVDRITFKLPRMIQNDWIRKYRDLPNDAKTRPFPEFVSFLRKERISAARMAEAQAVKGSRKSDEKHRTAMYTQQDSSRKTVPLQGTHG